MNRNIATAGLIVIAVVGIAAIVIVRLKTNDVPAGLIALTASAITSLGAYAGHRMP